MPDSPSPPNRLDYIGTYICPVCRHGEISSLSLMEALACDFCRHIFTVNLEQQVITMADSQLPLTWRWTGQTWKGIQQEVDTLWAYWFAGTLFVLLPTAIVGLGAYLFPPLPESPLAWLPLFWTILTFLTHLACLGWLMLEYYQIPLALYFQAVWQRLVSRS